MARPSYEKLFGDTEAEFFSAHRHLFELVQSVQAKGIESPQNHRGVLKLAQYALDKAPLDLNYQNPEEIVREITETDFTTFKCPDAL